MIRAMHVYKYSLNGHDFYHVLTFYVVKHNACLLLHVLHLQFTGSI